MGRGPAQMGNFWDFGVGVVSTSLKYVLQNVTFVRPTARISGIWHLLDVGLELFSLKVSVCVKNHPNGKRISETENFSPLWKSFKVLPLSFTFESRHSNYLIWGGIRQCKQVHFRLVLKIPKFFKAQIDISSFRKSICYIILVTFCFSFFVWHTKSRYCSYLLRKLANCFSVIFDCYLYKNVVSYALHVRILGAGAGGN